MLAAALISSGAVQAAEYDPTEVDSDTKEEEPVAIAEEEKMAGRRKMAAGIIMKTVKKLQES